jgi:diguanylate cyclase (GGDEF)-like protein
VVKEELADVLSEFARTVVTDFPIQGILDHLVKRIVDVLPVDGAGVTLMAPGLEPQYVAASNPAALRYEKLQTELGIGPCFQTYNSGKVVAVPDLHREKRFPEFTRRALESGLVAVFTFPMRREGVQLGALDLYRSTPGALTTESKAAAQTLADVATAYLLNAQARSDLEAASDEARQAALHDPLTGLPNRALIRELLDHALRAAQRTGKTSAVFFIDLDHFKDVNDTHGHHVGDQLLVAVAERVTGMLRPGDSLARLAGDEFVVLCEGLANQTEADPIAIRLDRELSRPFVLSGLSVQVSGSIGIAFTGHGAEGSEALLHDADLAMYQAKRERVGSHIALDLRDLHLTGHQAGLARAIRGAIARGEMHLEYQPIVAASDGRLTGAEALLRWTHPTRGVVSPSVFIPFAEQSGQITEIGRWVLEQALSDRHEWQQQGASSIGMSVNVSAHQLMSNGFAASVSALLVGSATEPEVLTLEITESVLVQDDERALIVLSELKQLGVHLALDDFGTGYSSLEYLDRLPTDVIKIDPKFVARLTQSPGSQPIVAAVIGLAHGRLSGVLLRPTDGGRALRRPHAPGSRRQHRTPPRCQPLTIL